MHIVTDIAELKARQDNLDAVHVAHAELVTASHSKHVVALDRRPLKFRSPAGSDCEDCNEPEFLVRDAVAGKELLMCRGCLNATRRLSLVHTHMVTHICCMCDITLDSFGIVSGANHRTEVPIEDFEDRDGVRQPGMKSRIESGLITIEDVEHKVMPGFDISQQWVVLHHLVHDDAQHCGGCRHVTHPGCNPRLCATIIHPH